MSATAATTALPSPQRPVVWLTAAVFAIGLLYLANTISLNQAALFMVGGALGVVLYHAAFGFTSGWRIFITERRGAGLRAQMIMLAVAVVLFFPALGAGTLFGSPVSGFVAPVGVSVVVGSFLFGLGMQLGGGCASGTLFTAGGGNSRMMVTLIFFILGSVLATHHTHWWFALPALEPVSLVHTLGIWGALALNLGLFAAIYALTLHLEKRRHGTVARESAAPRQGWLRFLQGPWPLVWGAVGLAVLNFMTLWLAGRPWGITGAFALWGAKIFETVGISVSHWPYWQGSAALEQSVFADVTSVMNFGIVAGALIAAGLAGRFAPSPRIPFRPLLAAVIGGLMLGYGARLAFGCNIGAYFSGVASGSLHGWVWLVFGFLGNMLGVRLRPWFFDAGQKAVPSGA